MRLTDVVIEYYNQCGPGQHLASDGYKWVEKRCAELGIVTTPDAIKREFRESAGYP